jgi:hypothetical protein
LKIFGSLPNWYLFTLDQLPSLPCEIRSSGAVPPEPSKKWKKDKEKWNKIKEKLDADITFLWKTLCDPCTPYTPIPTGYCFWIEVKKNWLRWETTTNKR